MKSFNILLSCSSNKTHIIEWIKKSVSKFDSKVKVYAGDSSLNVQTKYFCDRFWHMPKCIKKNYFKILTYCKKNNIKIIIPSSDKELMFWSYFKDKLKKKKIYVMVSNYYTIKLCLDKLKFYEKLKDFDFVNFTSNNLNDFKKNQLLIKKKRYGSGSKDIIIGKKEKLNKYLSYNSTRRYVFQKFINSKNEISVDCYFSKKNKLLKIVPRNRSLVQNGESIITSVIIDKSFFTKVNLIASKFNFVGHVMFQCFIYRKKIIVFECNPRIGGASIMSLYNNMDSIYYFILENLYPKKRLSISDKTFVNSKLLILKNIKFFK